LGWGFSGFTDPKLPDHKHNKTFLLHGNLQQFPPEKRAAKALNPFAAQVNLILQPRLSEGRLGMMSFLA